MNGLSCENKNSVQTSKVFFEKSQLGFFWKLNFFTPGEFFMTKNLEIASDEEK